MAPIGGAVVGSGSFDQQLLRQIAVVADLVAGNFLSVARLARAIQGNFVFDDSQGTLTRLSGKFCEDAAEHP